MIKQLNKSAVSKPERPVRILQFGEGNFLRAFVDWQIDIANEKGVMNSGVAICQPILDPEHKVLGMIDMLHKQDNLYHVYLEGIENKQPKKDVRMVKSVMDSFNPYVDYAKYEHYFLSPELKITISNTTTMVVDIQVDSRNIGFIQAGMTMELTDDWGNPVMGVVTNVAMSGEVGTGTTTYPVKLEVDNSMGSIYNGSWLNYKLVTAESVDCVTVPNQCIKRVTDVNGETHTVVFIQASAKPDNAVELDAAALGDAMPAPSDGFWPVPVTTGLSDTYSCEITEGLEADTVVFSGWGIGDPKSMGGGTVGVEVIG